MTNTEEEAGRPTAQTRRVPVEAVEWGFRLLAGREPVNRAEFDAFRALPNLRALRRAFTNLPEFHAFFSATVTGFPAWAVPLFLLRPPAVPDLEWKFAPPTLQQPGSQFCTAAQFDEAAFIEIVAAIGQRPSHSRLLWEQAWIIAVLAHAGLIAPGKAGLCFASDRDRVASLLASRGVAVQGCGTNAPTPRDREARRINLFHPDVVPLEDFDRLVSFVEADPRDAARLPPDSFDFCWSIGQPGALGSIAASLDFFEASLTPLRPGGLALHTFSFNLTSDSSTWDMPDLVLLRRSDIESLAVRLAPGGHRLLAFNTHPGLDLADETVKSEVPGPAGLRQRHGFAVATSFGLAIRKGGKVG